MSDDEGDTVGGSRGQDVAAPFSEEQQIWIRELFKQQLPRAPSSSGSLAPSATSAAAVVTSVAGKLTRA